MFPLIFCSEIFKKKKKVQVLGIFVGIGLSVNHAFLQMFIIFSLEILAEIKYVNIFNFYLHVAELNQFYVCHFSSRESS